MMMMIMVIIDDDDDDSDCLDYDPKKKKVYYSQRGSRMNDRGMKIAFFTCAFLSLIG